MTAKDEQVKSDADFMLGIQKSMRYIDAEIAHMRAQSAEANAAALLDAADLAKEVARGNALTAFRAYRKAHKRRGCEDCELGRAYASRWQAYLAAYNAARLTKNLVAMAQTCAKATEMSYALARQLSEDAPDGGEGESQYENESDVEQT